MATPTPSTNTPQKHLMALSSPAPRSVPPMTFDSPAVLNMLNEGGIGMGISMSGMGMSQLGLSQLGRGDEDERRRRLEGIVTMLKGRPGRVSEEGLIALCRKDGIDFERSVERDGTTVLTLVIGNEAMCDISILNGDVTSVKLELASDDDHTFKDSGSRILFKSLTPRPGANKINLMLDQFAMNLDKLLRMDKLSAENGGVPCFKAIFAMHKSLRRLFEHEKKMALALMDANTPDAAYRAEREVLCKKSGRARLNAGTCLGLSLEYWMDRRHLIRKKPKSTQSTKDKTTSMSETYDDEHPEDAFPTTNKTYSLTIECESSPSSMYTPIRIPDSWISDAIEVEKAPDGPDAVINNLLNNTSTIDWLDPKPTYLDSAAGAAGDHDALNIENAPGRLPNIRFVARFNPPLVVPLSVYVQIVNSVGLETPQDLHPTTFVGLAIRPGEQDPGSSSAAGGDTIEIQHSRNVLVVDSKTGKETTRPHMNSLYVPKLEYSRALESLPFQHPRQLVELLPTLRQYAMVTSLVQGDFVSPPNITNNPNPNNPDTTSERHQQEAGGEEKTPPLQLDISLSYAQPAPRLTLTIPHPLSPSPHLPLPPPTTSPTSSTTLTGDTNNTPPPPPPLSNPQDLFKHLFLSPIPAFSSPSPPSSTASSSSREKNVNINANEKEKDKETIHYYPPLKIVLDILANGRVFVHEENLVPSPTTSGLTAGGHGSGDVMDIDPTSTTNDNNKPKNKLDVGGEGSKQNTMAGVAGGSASEDDIMKRKRRIARALDVVGDLGVWSEWVRAQVLV
ncbi:hypothetical protein DM02DRAFT_614985 [Periconia macrospinosa]|uniref:Mediator of RNA polymerase II transcription subunit 1 n=1 Tax=Periconia macrospinosa TaxID=97972 RepID=A0A2V1DNH5_9PLEO|nr:hypothetical protein DM02DRAFT_614985 [Periconia macrospinosa]